MLSIPHCRIVFTVKIVYTAIYERKVMAILTPSERDAVENAMLVTQHSIR